MNRLEGVREFFRFWDLYCLLLMVASSGLSSVARSAFCLEEKCKIVISLAYVSRSVGDSGTVRSSLLCPFNICRHRKSGVSAFVVWTNNLDRRCDAILVQRERTGVGEWCIDTRADQIGMRDCAICMSPTHSPTSTSSNRGCNQRASQSHNPSQKKVLTASE